jgi:hypothetical protein
VHSRAAAAGPDVANHYLLKDIERQVAHSFLADAAHLLSQRASAAPITAAAIHLYIRLAAAILMLQETQRSLPLESELQAALYCVYSRTMVLSHLLTDQIT